SFHASPLRDAMTKVIVHLIDDDAGVLDSLRMYLSAKGFIARTHRPADDFLWARQREGPADCIVSDVRMPRLSRLWLQTLLNRARSKEPLVLITGSAAIGAAVSAIKAGAFDFIEKPVSERRLVASIKAAVAQAQRDRAEQQQLMDIEARVQKLSPREQE